MVLVDATNKFGPEGAASTGYPGFDEQVTDLQIDVNDRFRAAVAGARDELKKRLLAETDPLVRQDLEIVIQSAEDAIEGNDLFQKHLLPYFDIGQLMFFGNFLLLQDDVDPARRPAALVRLKRYTGLAPGYTPMTELAKAFFNDAAKDPKRMGPYKLQVEQALANTARYKSGIRDLYKKYKIDGAEPALAAMDKQLDEYSDWIRANVLTRARADSSLPAEIYANNLKNVGLDITPQQLMQRAQVAYIEYRNEMKVIAALIAKERGWADPDYRAVIRALKKDALTKEQTEAYFHDIIGQIEGIIRREAIVTLPERAMQMRLGSDAENAAQPAPHMQPPPLVNNKGERGTFVLPAGNPEATGGKSQAYDDFSYKAGVWTITAHEGRPGHELQYATMVERGVSQARSIYAFNSVNIEGWALYAEAEMKPYEPLDGQLIALQGRLHRAARAFLDPMVNLGLMSKERVFEILTQDICLSEAYARQEVDRYTFRSPGQATAYFYGYIRLMELRTATEIALGAKFDRHSFNDFILSQGLLPPSLMAKAVHEQFAPAQLAK